MVKHSLMGGIAITPTPNDGKEITVVGSAEHLYSIELTPEAVAQLVEQLSMSTEELTQFIERKQAAQKLALPGQGPMGQSPNGNGSHSIQDLRREQ